MDKRIKFSEQPKKVKIIYATVVAVLCVTAIVIGIVSAASRRNDDLPIEEPTGNLPSVDENKPSEDENKEESKPDENEEENKEEKLTFISPVVGSVTKSHSIDTPVFSDTLGEWRVHTGIDISAEEGSKVYAAADGKVTKVYNDPLFGKTVEITHSDDLVSIYSNLQNTDIVVKEGEYVKSGALLGLVGDTSLSELADESHLHFGIKLKGVSVNPLDYISDDSKEASLGIING